MPSQVNLDGDIISEDACKTSAEDIQIWKSVLQKAIRRGMAEKAMYSAYKLSTEQTGEVLWRRLSLISVEDVGTPDAIVAVEVLKKLSRGYGYGTWDGQRCALCAAKILSEAEKDRRADEFLELMHSIKKHGDDTELQLKLMELEAIPDEAKDMHTTIGRAMGRGPEYWYEVSSETAKKSREYAMWREWWKALMLRVERDYNRQAGPSTLPERSRDDSERDGCC